MRFLTTHPRLVRAFLLVVSLGTACLISEAVVRATSRNQVLLFPRYHTSARYGDWTIRRFRPNSRFLHTSPDGRWQFRINAQGFRNDTSFSYDKPPGIIRILSVGDSHTAGFEVRQEETFSYVTRELLKRRGISSQVINSGVSGFGTAEELVFLMAEGVRYHPDVVVLGFYANDFEDNVKAGLFSISDGTLVLRSRQHIPGVAILDAINRFALLRWLSEHSYAYSLVANSLWMSAKRALLSRQRLNLETEYAVPAGRIGNYEQELTRLLLERLFAVCREHDIRLIILDIPRPTSDENELQSSVPDSMIEFFRSHSDLFVDSRETFADMKGRYRKLHVPHGQRHISALAHRRFAERIAAYVAGLPRADLIETDRDGGR